MFSQFYVFQIIIDTNTISIEVCKKQKKKNENVNAISYSLIKRPSFNLLSKKEIQFYKQIVSNKTLCSLLFALFN